MHRMEPLHATTSSAVGLPVVAFVGGGNMSSALIGGLIKAGADSARILVVEPFAEQRVRLGQRFAGLELLAAPGASLRAAQAVVWAVKPQQFAQAASDSRAYLGDALHVSIMAGVRCGAIARQTGASRMVRTMPNTPALIGRGITGLFASVQASAADRAVADALLAPAGARVWVEREEQLDAVTAVSGSGPAYVFLLAEELARAGVEAGLPEALATRLARETVAGSGELLHRSELSSATLRQNVTSPGGTTAAALAVLTGPDGMQSLLTRAVAAATKRSKELAK